MAADMSAVEDLCTVWRDEARAVRMWERKEVNEAVRGEVEAANVVIVYRTPPNAGADGVPLREILGFERVHLPPKGSATLRFPLSAHDFELADERGTFRRVAGRWALSAGGETLAHVDVPPAG